MNKKQEIKVWYRLLKQQEKQANKPCKFQDLSDHIPPCEWPVYKLPDIEKKYRVYLESSAYNMYNNRIEAQFTLSGYGIRNGERLEIIAKAIENLLNIHIYE